MNDDIFPQEIADLSKTSDTEACVRAKEAFDVIPDALELKTLDHEHETAVAPNRLPGRLTNILHNLGFSGIRIAARVPVFPSNLALAYFNGIGDHAANAGTITDSEHQESHSEIWSLARRDRLFGSVGYFLFSATVA